MNSKGRYWLKIILAILLSILCLLPFLLPLGREIDIMQSTPENEIWQYWYFTQFPEILTFYIISAVAWASHFILINTRYIHALKITALLSSFLAASVSFLWFGGFSQDFSPESGLLAGMLIFPGFLIYFFLDTLLKWFLPAKSE